EDAPFLGDTWFYRVLSALGQGRTRLLETGEGAPLPPPPPLSDGRHFPRLRLRLTAGGEQTPPREADRRPLLRLHPRVGGTHLTRADTWRWDPAGVTLVRP